MKRLAATLICLSLAGCAESILSKQENDVLRPNTALVEPVPSENLKDLKDAAKLANELSAAYYEAAQQAQSTQDAASAIVILTAASVVAGAVKDVSDAALANRGLAAVGVQQVAQRGVGKPTIESIYDGAQIFNCIGIVATIYENDDVLAADPKTTLITLAVMREVRINVRKGFTRDVAEYSAVIGAFKAVIEGDASVGSLGLQKNAIAPRAVNAKPEQLEVYLTRLGGCVSAKQASQSNK